MSKAVKPDVYIDDYVMSIDSCRENARSAHKNITDAKRRLWGLVMATPRDIAGDDDTVEKLEELFSELMDELEEYIVDNYKYNIVADDAEYGPDSLVKMAFEEDKAEEAKREAENARRDAFFKSSGLNQYNMDDQLIYDAWANNEISLDFPVTPAAREGAVKYVKEKYSNL